MLSFPDGTTVLSADRLSAEMLFEEDVLGRVLIVEDGKGAEILPLLERTGRRGDLCAYNQTPQEENYAAVLGVGGEEALEKAKAKADSAKIPLTLLPARLYTGAFSSFYYVGLRSRSLALPPRVVMADDFLCPTDRAGIAQGFATACALLISAFDEGYEAFLLGEEKRGEKILQTVQEVIKTLCEGERGREYERVKQSILTLLPFVYESADFLSERYLRLLRAKEGEGKPWDAFVCAYALYSVYASYNPKVPFCMPPDRVKNANDLEYLGGDLCDSLPSDVEDLSRREYVTSACWETFSAALRSFPTLAAAYRRTVGSMGYRMRRETKASALLSALPLLAEQSSGLNLLRTIYLQGALPSF